MSGPGCGESKPAGDAGPGDAAADVAGDTEPDGPGHPAPALRINELVPDNDGLLIDEVGQADDWIEIYNADATAIDLGGWALGEGKKKHLLPALTLAPGQTVVFFADGTPEQGPRHLSFALPADGSRVVLIAPDGTLADALTYPGLGVNEAFARFPDGSATLSRCRYATPGQSNGSRCGPLPPPGLPADVSFAPFPWPAGWGAPRGPLVVSEAALRPARFVEVANVSAAPVALADFVLRIAPQPPGQPWPGLGDGVELRWPHAGAIAPGEHLMVPIAEADVAAIAADAAFEGVLTVFRADSGAPVHRLDFMRVPEGAALTLIEGGAGAVGTHHLCREITPGAANTTCTELPARDVGDRVRHLRTAGDFAALAEGGTELNSRSVKFLVDMMAGDVVHFLSSRAWDLHYTWVRERIYGAPHLDRCVPSEAAVFDAGWRDFSDREYLQTDGRRFLLGTLVHYGTTDMLTVEFDRGDEITAEQMRRAYFAVASHVLEPKRWAVRSQGGRQVLALKAIEGTLPVLDPNAPFRGITFQPLTPGIAYGVLKFVPTVDLEAADLGVDVIVVTDDVPNDVPLIGGLVTEAFQTPLSHIGILTRNRGTPDMALQGAHNDPRLVPFFDKLVRLEVTGGGFTVREAPAAEAQAFWDKRRPHGDRVTPRLDASVRGLQDLHGKGLDDLPSVGAKAAQLAELLGLQSQEPACPGALPVPVAAFALPIAHSLDHFTASGARALFESMRTQPEFTSDPRVRHQGLAAIRAAILAHPVDPAVITAVTAMAQKEFPNRRFRMRSSSNTEDLPAFSGAGLYTSVSAALGDPQRTIENGLRTVWSSLWANRAYDERELGLIDQTQVGMGVLMHEAFNGIERANGVAASRDIKDPTRGDSHYINAQAGEASVTNPAPGVSSEELIYTWWQMPPVVYLSRSSLVNAPVLHPEEIATISCYMRAIHTHFAARIDPEHKNRWFTVESEWKLLGSNRALVFKQARPYSFGALDVPVDCREL